MPDATSLPALGQHAEKQSMSDFTRNSNSKAAVRQSGRATLPGIVAGKVNNDIPRNTAKKHGLDFFVGCEGIIRQVREHLQCSVGETAVRTLQVTIMHDIQLLHDLPLQTLNDRLKKYPFVDPQPFDELLTEMIDAVLEWMQWVSRPEWIIEVALKVGTIQQKQVEHQKAVEQRKGQRTGYMPSLEPQKQTGAFEVSSADFEELKETACFTYPLPLKLRDLQTMVRPFMEVRSSHHIAGLDTIVAELVRVLLRLFHSVKAWEESMVQHIKQLAETANDARVIALGELCALLEMDIFEASHRLHRVDGSQFILTPGEIDMLCQKLPLFLDQRMLKGPPTKDMDINVVPTWDSASQNGFARRRGMTADSFTHEESPLDAIRREALSWWSQNNFVCAAPTRVLCSTLLKP
eukprot:gnl/TRDRNA2_/TRDRNA2_152377_c0_seq2.p1 gnl/TRDRNA2_/TRDRNA2_152377_c0~~gnl/TRDRNA2_/TRDRNA2_152377_c0_seq2.p1  ORF type:complete len:407 (-),score=69.95 gnl/TRDRNA2_/TRDRNA2_152377_c0_seq2:28-1248(-)